MYFARFARVRFRTTSVLGRLFRITRTPRRAKESARGHKFSSQLRQFFFSSSSHFHHPATRTFNVSCTLVISSQASLAISSQASSAIGSQSFNLHTVFHLPLQRVPISICKPCHVPSTRYTRVPSSLAAS